MSKKKYVMSGGLAFSENQDMEKLRKLSQKGWHVKKFSFLGYTLEQGKQEGIRPMLYTHPLDVHLNIP